jgi:hypothetical protein
MAYKQHGRISPRLAADARGVSIFCILFVLALGARVAPAIAFPAASRGTLYVLGVTLNQEGLGKGNAVNDFNWCVDDLNPVFEKQSKALYREVKTSKIQGMKATLKNIDNALNSLERQAEPNDVVVLYMGMHGGTDPKEGWSVGLADGKEITGKAIKQKLGKFRCQVICLIETCGSGGFARPHKDDVPLPPNVSALCCCKASQTATNELDIAIIEALHGRADVNHDGVVTLKEMVSYTRARYAISFAKEGDDPVVVEDKDPDEIPLTRVADNSVSIFSNGAWYSGTLVGMEKDKYRVTCDGFNNDQPPGKPWTLTNLVSRDEIVLPGEGKPLLVQQSDKWRCARLLSMDGAKFHVRYANPSVRPREETVTAERVKHPPFIDPISAARKQKNGKNL